MARKDPQLKLRLTEEMKAWVTEAARKNSRSVNAEIVARLDESFAPASRTNPDQSRIISFDELADLWASRSPDERPKVSVNLAKALDAWLEFSKIMGTMTNSGSK